MRSLLLALALLLAAPSAQAQKSDDKPAGEPAEASVAEAAVAEAPDGVVGTWDYTVRPDDPVASGTFVLTMDEGGYDGTFQTDGPRKMLDIRVDGDHLAFAFDQPNMGRIEIQGTVTGGAFEGTAQPTGQDALPMAATLQTAASE